MLSVEGDRTGGLRLLRATKNRYGSTEEVGVFEMAERGLVEVADPARAFLADHDAPAPGSVVAPVLEGSRPLLVEVQALVAPSGAPSPRRTASGIDPNRLALLVAVLGRRAGIGLSGHDVYANLAGGLTVERARPRPAARPRARLVAPRPAARHGHRRDRRGRPARASCAPSAGLDRRLREAARLGFTRAIVPRSRAQPRRRVDRASRSSSSGSLAEAIRAALADPVAAVREPVLTAIGPLRAHGAAC